VAIVQVSDDRDAVSCTNEACASVFVHHGLVRLKGSHRAELDLQELRAGDRVHSKRVHAVAGSAGLSLILPRQDG
jgi:hypothetical protein